MSYMCHWALSKQLLKIHRRMCPKCKQKGRLVEMEEITIDPPFQKYGAWVSYICPECHYER